MTAAEIPQHRFFVVYAFAAEQSLDASPQYPVFVAHAYRKSAVASEAPHSRYSFSGSRTPSSEALLAVYSAAHGEKCLAGNQAREVIVQLERLRIRGLIHLCLVPRIESPIPDVRDIQVEGERKLYLRC